MTESVAERAGESRAFEADVAKLLNLMVHSVYAHKDVFLRELISNAADACEKLRYEALGAPELLADDPKARIVVALDPAKGLLTVEDNGIGMDRSEMIEALGTIARSGTKAFVERLEAARTGENAALIGQFGVGFYSSFMVADRVDVISRRAGGGETWRWSSDGAGAFSIAPATPEDGPARGTRVVLHLKEDAKAYTEAFTIERLIRQQSGHVPVLISLVEKPDAEAKEIADGSALWTKPKADIPSADYTDFYRSVAGQFDEPAMTIHFRAEGRHEYTMLAFVPSSAPFDLFDPDRRGRIKLYVKRVFITDEAEIVPRYLRFVRGLVDSADLPLNVSREKIQESPILTAIRKGVTGRVISELEKLAQNEPDNYHKVWDQFGAVLKEGLYEDSERRDALLALARFKTTAAPDAWRSLKDYAASLRPNQTSLYYISGSDLERLSASPHLEGFRARGVEVLLLADPVDSFWPTAGVSYEGKPFKSVTQGAADLSLIPLLDASAAATPEADGEVQRFIAFVKDALSETLSDVRASDRLTDSAVCLVAPEFGPDRQLERLLAGSGRLKSAAKPVLEINPKHALVRKVAALGDEAQELKRDVAHLLFDEARVLDGDPPEDARAFSDRLSRILERALSA